MNVKLVLFVTLLMCVFSACKKKTSSDDGDMKPLQNLRLTKDARYYYHYDTEGRISAQDIMINGVVTRYWDFYYNGANKIEKKIQVATEDTYSPIRNEYYYYDEVNNRLDKLVRTTRYTLNQTEFTSDSICLYYDENGILSYSINTKSSYKDSVVYIDFKQGTPIEVLTYRKVNGTDTYLLNLKFQNEYDQNGNLVKSSSESFDPSFPSKREISNTFEAFSDQMRLILSNTFDKSHYYSPEMSWWRKNDNYIYYTLSTQQSIDYIKNCTESFTYTLKYDADAFIIEGTSVGISTCYDGNNFNNTYNYKEDLVYEKL